MHTGIWGGNPCDPPINFFSRAAFRYLPRKGSNRVYFLIIGSDYRMICH
jgi:hypothetical protein